MIRSALAALALFAGPAAADETWTTPAGPVIYEADMGMVAVLSFPYAAAWPGEVPEFAGERARLYMPGLGGNFDDRSIHDGYWTVPGMPACSASLTAPDGITTQRWGRARIVFDRAAFPTGFTLLVGTCLDEPTRIIRADLP